MAFTKARIIAALAVLAALVAFIGTNARADQTAVNLFGGAHPVTVSDGETSSVELGLRFTTDTPGKATEVRFYKGSANKGTHVGHLWSATGAKLATVTFTGETASGWQTATFATPVDLTPGVTYVVSYLAPKGRYAADAGFTGRDNGPLHAPANNGVYRYGTNGGFPTDTFDHTNYWVDVTFAPTPPPTTTVAPTTTETPTTEPATTTVPELPGAPGFVVRDASNTGPTGTLTPCAGNRDITTAGTVLDHCDITGWVNIMADDVTITNSRITGGQITVGRGASGDKVVHHPTIVDTEIIGGGEHGIGGVNDVDGVYQRNDIHGFENCATMWTSTRAQLLDNYCHDPAGASDAHFDGFEIYGTVGGITITGNHVIETGHTDHDVAPLNVTNESPIQGTVVVERNLLESGSTAYVILAADVRAGHGGITAVINDNRLKRFGGGNYLDLRNASGASSYSGSGNVDADTGADVAVGQ